jgi:hypothetical protein
MNADWTPFGWVESMEKAAEKTMKPRPLEALYADMAEIQTQGRDKAKNEIQKRILRAPDNAPVSKRDLLGLNRRSGKKADMSLFQERDLF